MEQRQLRLGDILDDYCPRERRITNHAVVAMLDDKVQQTRCTTCQAEHDYKGARVPPRRKKRETPDVLYEQVLAGLDKPSGPASEAASVPPVEPSKPQRQPRTHAAPPPQAPAPPEPNAIVTPSPQSREAQVAAPATGPAPPASETQVEDGPVHRPLIRATLPRPEGQVPARPAPEFTIRQSGGRGGAFRDDQRGGARNWSGDSGNGNNGNRAGGSRPPRPHSAKPSRGPGGRPPFGHPAGPRSLDRSQPHARPRQAQPVRPGKKRSR